MELKNQKVTVLGLGQSGYDSAIFLQKLGAHVFVSEQAKTELTQSNQAKLEAKQIKCEVGQHSIETILTSDLIIISPGISPTDRIYQQVASNKIPIWSEIELAYRFCPAKIIGITGTNGKTTVSTLIAGLLRQHGYQTVLCGNIGHTFVGALDSMTNAAWAVVELSSFQLEHTHLFKPHIAILLNITDNHFNWHGTFTHYANAKFKIFRQQSTNDYAILNARDRETMSRLDQIRSQKLFFNRTERSNSNEEVCQVVAERFQIGREQVQDMISHFPGIPHRLEQLPIKSDIQYINDSKSTSIASLKWALERMKEPVVLIAGGQFKGGSFESLKDLITQKVSHVVAIGEAAPMIEQAWHAVVPVVKAQSFREAVLTAKKLAEKPRVVLLSPACASFDMFKNYIDRGDQFRNMVQELENSPRWMNIISSKKG